MLDWMKCNVGSGERKGEEVFPMLKIKVKCRLGAVGESNFGIKTKKESDTWGRNLAADKLP